MDRNASIAGPAATLADVSAILSIAPDLAARPPDTTHAPLSKDSDGDTPWPRRRWVIVLCLAVLVHVLLIAGILYLSVPPAAVRYHIIPVKLVTEMPPQPVKPPQPQAKTQPKPKAPPKPTPPKPPAPKKKPPIGPLASEEMGNPDAPADAKQFVQSPPSGPAKPVDGGSTAKPKAETADPDLTPNLEALGLKTPDKPVEQSWLPDGGDLATPKGDTDKPDPLTQNAARDVKPPEEPIEKPQPKEGGVRVQALTKQRSPTGHRGKIPGPDASEDEYMAYIRGLINEHRDLAQAIMTTHGLNSQIKVNIMVRRNGAIVWINVIESSGSALVDKQVVAMINAVDRFPPMPNYFDGDGTILVWTQPLR